MNKHVRVNMSFTEWKSKRNDLQNTEEELIETEECIKEILNEEPLLSTMKRRRLNYTIEKNELMDETVKLVRKNLFEHSFEESKEYLTFLQLSLEQNGYTICCSSCDNDFSSLLLTPDTLKHAGTNCLKCGDFICFGCIVKNLHINATAADSNSVGYYCPSCNFQNCNLVERQSSSFPSGVSTCENPHKNGKYLETSKKATLTHKDNLAFKIPIYISDDDDDKEEEEEDDPSVILIEY